MPEVPPAAYPSGPPLAPPPPPVPPGAIRPGGLWPEPAEEPPARRKVSGWVVVVAVVAVAALIGGLVAAVTQGDDDADIPGSAAPRPTPSTSAPAATTTTAPSDFDAVVQAIEDFVSAERGLPWRREVTVDLADDAEFEQRLLEDFDDDAADLVLAGQALQAVGLVEPGTDLVAAMRSLLGAGVVGFYDPETDELVVRGTDTSPYVRAVIAHELTHALDDQHFELDRPALDDAHDESGFGFTALVEGNAVRVENAYRATFTPEEEQDAVAEELAIGSGYDFDTIPIVLFEAIGAPYILGPDLIATILDAGGQPRLDASFAAPPVTSEALLDPDTYVDGQGPVPVPPPAADGPELDRNVLGELGVAQLLGQSSFLLGGFGGVPEAVQGWGGDAYVTWQDGDRFCLRANLVGDTPEDTAELAAALDDWAAGPGAVEATVTTSDIITVTSCA